MNVQLLISGAGGQTYEPIICGDIVWETVRKGAPSSLNFTVVKDGGISFQEGAKVQLKVDGEKVFIGFIFTKERDKQQQISCTAYDQLRYLKNKDTYVYTDKTASEVLKMVASDFGLNLGEVVDTGFKIAQRDEDNQTLFDIVLNALDLTLDATGKVYVLYDDFGKISLKNIEDMKLSLLIDPDTAEDFNYSSSIDKDTYNQVKVIKEDSETGKRKLYVARDNNRIQNWGVLQFFTKVDEGANPESLVNTILTAKNRKTRTLNIKNALGDPTVRAGCSLPVSLNLGDIVVNEHLMCEKVTHRFSSDHHFMDIEFYNLKGS